MATLFVDFPEYSGLSNQFATSLWDFSKNREILFKIHHSFAFNYTKLQISCVLLAFTINANAYKSV